EPIGGCATPLRIGWREMNADIAVGECPEDGVDERVKNDVGVGMSGQSTPMGNAHAAEHDMIAVAELVNVEAKTGAHIAQAREGAPSRGTKIPVGGEFPFPGSPPKRAALAAAPSGEGGVTAKIVATRRFRPAMRLDEGGKIKSLRGLHQAQMRAVDRAGHAA